MNLIVSINAVMLYCTKSKTASELFDFEISKITELFCHLGIVYYKRNNMAMMYDYSREPFYGLVVLLFMCITIVHLYLFPYKRQDQKDVYSQIVVWC